MVPLLFRLSKSLFSEWRIGLKAIHSVPMDLVQSESILQAAQRESSWAVFWLLQNEIYRLTQLNWNHAKLMREWVARQCWMWTVTLLSVSLLNDITLPALLKTTSVLEWIQGSWLSTHLISMCAVNRLNCALRLGSDWTKIYLLK